MKRFLLSLCLALAMPAWATNYFVSQNGSDSYNGKAAVYDGTNGPWQTPHCSGLLAGDVENLIWTPNPQATSFFCSNKAVSSGTASSPILVQGVNCVGTSCVTPNLCSQLSPNYCPGYLPQIRVSSGYAVQLRDNVSYMQIQYLDTYDSSVSGSGFLIGSSGYSGTVHHILLAHNRVSYAGGTCIQEEFAAYVTTLDNEAFDCGMLDTAASDSAISYLAPTRPAGDDGLNHGCYGMPADMIATYGNAFSECIIRNRCWYSFKGVVASDGNCIILDDWPCHQFLTTNCMGLNYPYAAAVLENTGFSTDGRFIHGWLINTTVGITRIAYNTGYNACQQGVSGGPCSPTSGSIDCLGNSTYLSNGCEIDHNIIYAQTNTYGIDISFANPTGTFIVCGNDVYGGLGVLHSDGSANLITQSGNITLDPKLTNPTASPITADFRPTAATPSTSC